MSRIEHTGRVTRFTAGRRSERHIERRADPERVPQSDPVRARDLGESARELLASPAFVEALEELKGVAYFDLMNSEPGAGGEAQRTLSHLRLKTLGDIEAKLAGMVEDAKFATDLEADKSEADGA